MSAGIVEMNFTATSQDRIGPNAILQVIDSVTARLGLDQTQSLFDSAGLQHHLTSRPQTMVSESDVAALQRQLRENFGPELAREISWDAGLRTGDYLLANRIPKLAQVVLRRVPAGLAARVLAKAIGKHSWTFAGSGTLHIQPGSPFSFIIQRNPICSRIQSDVPVCHYYAATFERIFQAIVHPNSRVVEIECEATGGSACVFQITW